MNLLPQLATSGIKFIIFSGGEPLVRKDIYSIGEACKRLGIVSYLSTNGLYIHSHNVQKIVDTFDYVGISIDGSEETHDKFRALEGSFALSVQAIKLLLEHSNKVGVRFTLTENTVADLPYIFELAESLNIPKVYISHLVYSGRGLENRDMDISKQTRYEATKFIIEKAFFYHENNRNIEVVTGNMEMDAILLFDMFASKYPAFAHEMFSRLQSWGGNSAGRKLVNIDSHGNVKPDPFFPVTIGNIREMSFEKIWHTDKNPLLSMLREHPRKLGGDCTLCQYIEICNGGSRARAHAVYGSITEYDPSCYLSEIKSNWSTK
jgi:radical SAM protein with 4Fe4S-binding SPASM domain